MNGSQSDALVFFGATGDLVYKKIFPALYAMERRGHLTVPVIGVASSDWTVDQFRARARESVEKHGGFDSAIFAKLQDRLRDIRGDYGASATHAALREELGGAAHPLHYLAMPPSLFASVIEGLGQSGCARGARVILEKPSGRDLPSAQALSATFHTVFDESSVFRIDHDLGKDRCRTCWSSASRTPPRSYSGTAMMCRTGRSPWPKAATEVLVTFKRPPLSTLSPGETNHVRFRLNPDVTIAIGARTKRPGDQMISDPTELKVVPQPDTREMQAYERLNRRRDGGCGTLFARQDGVEAARAILGNATPVVRGRPTHGGNVLVDDKIRILTAVKKAWGARGTTIVPRQGHYAFAPDLTSYPPPDITIARIGDLLKYGLPALLEAAPTKDRR